MALAEELLAQAGSREPYLRSAARSAYYAVYHLVARRLAMDPSRPDAGHAAVRQELLSQPIGADDQIRIAKRRWDRLYAMRVHADYELDRVFAFADAETAVLDAASVFAALRPIHS
jgi:hypothetical protein